MAEKRVYEVVFIIDTDTSEADAAGLVENLQKIVTDQGGAVTRSVIGPGATIGDETVVSDAVVGDGVSVGANCELREGVRLWPGITIPDGGLRFSGSA